MIDHVSDTAFWVATYRARESARADALFRDPLAARLSGEKGRRIAGKITGSRYTEWAVVIRTCIIDAYIRELVTQGIDLVLNLGAGLDTRPYRLDLPSSLQWIEVDFPPTVELKNRELREESPKCRLERVSLDLSDEIARSRLFSEISSRSSKILVLTEGVVPYLTDEQVGSLANGLRAHSQFRFWIVDYFAPDLVRYMRRGRIKRQLENAPVRFAPGDWFGFFEERGWASREVRYVATESERLGRSVPAPWWLKVLRIFFRAKMKERFRKFSGYVLLEPKANV